MRNYIQPAIIILLIGAITYLLLAKDQEEREIIEPEETTIEEIASNDYPVFDNCKSLADYLNTDQFKTANTGGLLFENEEGRWQVESEYQYLKEICYASNKEIFLVSASEQIGLGIGLLKIYEVQANGEYKVSNEIRYLGGKASFGARKENIIPITLSTTYPDMVSGTNETTVEKAEYNLSTHTLTKK